MNRAKTRLKISIFALVLSFLLCNVATYAWFAMNRRVDSEDMAMRIDGNTYASVNDYRIYKRIGSEDGKAVEVSSLSMQGPVEMTEYDTVFTDRNVDTPIIIKTTIEVPVEDEDGNPLNVTKVIMKATCPDGDWTTTNTAAGTLKSNLSNIIRIRAIVGTSALNSLTDSTQIYYQSRAVLDTTAGQSFALSQHNGAKYENVSKNTELAISMTGFASGQNLLTVYIELSYNEDQVASYIAQNGIVVSADNGLQDIVEFPYDLLPFTFEYE